MFLKEMFLIKKVNIIIINGPNNVTYCGKIVPKGANRRFHRLLSMDHINKYSMTIIIMLWNTCTLQPKHFFKFHTHNEIRLKSNKQKSNSYLKKSKVDRLGYPGPYSLVLNFKLHSYSPTYGH